MSLYLYYDSNKNSLVKGNTARGCYIQEHDEKGFKNELHKQTLDIPNTNVKIEVSTNLHYGAASFMLGTISVMDKVVLNFHDTSLTHPVNRVYAKPGDWDMLFNGIIQLYNSIYTSEQPINIYFDLIEKALQESSAKYFENLLNVTSRLAEIANFIQNSVYNDNPILRERMRQACGLLIKNISNPRIKGVPTESMRNNIESKLSVVLTYLSTCNNLLGLFNYLTYTAPMLSVNSSYAPQSSSAEQE